MTTQYFKRSEIKASNPAYSQSRSVIETVFYGNNVEKVTSVQQAYELAVKSPGTIVTDIPVYRPETMGLAADAKILVFNDGSVTGRCAAARRILGSEGVNEKEYALKISDAIYDARYKKLYHAEAVIGLDKDFMVKAHLCIPEGEENIMYSWLLNFQAITAEYAEMYKNSKLIEGEGDIYIFSDPQWKHPEHPLGLTYFDPKHNCAALLGMRYFGEHKKGTLTLAWGIANRHGYASCHGGQKRYNLANGDKFVVSVFGLSGSGKSTITHAKHDGKYDITVLHDDAFVISTENGSSVALEPTYFDKTQDYPLDNPDNKFLVTIQNNAVTVDEDGKKVVLTEDLRNGNGRAIKSKIWSPNRVDKIDEACDAIIWLMKDATLPPVLKITDPVLASVMGATLATKRTTAERLAAGVDPNALVVEPYANPFRTYPLSEDYGKFKQLFEERNVDCYILNTGFFMDKKVTKEITLGSIEAIVENTANFVPFGNIDNMYCLDIDGFNADFNDAEYVEQLKARMADRVNFIRSKETAQGGFDKLPDEAVAAIEKLAAQI
ncbi:MAG: phosphoenolpyruvate carboxykinase (ATP) [Clostridia bacterium]|nr:phosphoenolpyruvate carboxykinase (ATP) [Clostridia bacterium]